MWKYVVEWAGSLNRDLTVLTYLVTCLWLKVGILQMPTNLTKLKTSKKPLPSVNALCTCICTCLQILLAQLILIDLGFCLRMEFWKMNRLWLATWIFLPMPDFEHRFLMKLSEVSNRQLLFPWTFYFRDSSCPGFFKKSSFNNFIPVWFDKFFVVVECRLLNFKLSY